MRNAALWIGLLWTVCLLGLAGLSGCSTTRVLADDQARLSDNKVSIVAGERKDAPYSASSLEPYIKQKPNSGFLGMVSPLLYVYNWQNGKGGGWDRFCQKVGQPPVVFDEDLVEDSVSSMLDHLEYDGWYGSSIEPSAKIRKKIAKVQYDVTLGKRFPISDITYRVRDTALAALMAADSAHFTVRPGDLLAEAALEKESERIAQYFRNSGYWGFSKNYFFFYADTTTVRDTASLIVAIEN